jgi:hypothetical protein
MLAQRVTEREIKSVDDASYESVVAASPYPVMVCFCSSGDEVSGSWLAEIESSADGRLRVVRGILSDVPQSAMQNGVVMTPAYMIFSNGSKRAVAVGHLGPEDLKRFVERALG